MIPRLVHRLWLGPREMPDRYREYADRWRELNPGWEVVDWDQDTLPSAWLRNADIWDLIEERGVNSGAPMPPDQAIAVQRADVAGYEIVYALGGIYVNCDIEPVRPLEPWIDDVVGDRAFAGYEDQRYLVNAVIGGPRHHPFWLRVLENLGPRYHMLPGYMMNIVTGPYLLTDTWERWPEPERSRVFYAAPREVFHPVHHGHVPAGGWVKDFNPAEHPTALTVHHWGHKLTG